METTKGGGGAAVSALCLHGSQGASGWPLWERNPLPQLSVIASFSLLYINSRVYSQ